MTSPYISINPTLWWVRGLTGAISLLGFLNSLMTLQKISLNHEVFQVPVQPEPSLPLWLSQWKHDQPRAYYESRGNGATEKKGAQICTSIFSNVILKSTPVLSWGERNKEMNKVRTTSFTTALVWSGMDHKQLHFLKSCHQNLKQ